MMLAVLLMCAPFEVNADTLKLPSQLKEIESKAFEGLQTDLVYFPKDIEYIASDAFDGASFTGTGPVNTYAYKWCMRNGIPWQTAGEIVYSGKTSWQRYVQKYYLKATVHKRDEGDTAVAFNAKECKYAIKLTFHIDEIFNQVRYDPRMSYVEVLLKGWTGDDEDDNNFQDDSTGYNLIYRAQWAYNIRNVHVNPDGTETVTHDDMRPRVWEGVIMTIDTGAETFETRNVGDLHTVYDMTEDYVSKREVNTNYIIDPETGLPYEKLRVKITAAFTDTSRIAFHTSTVDNAFVAVYDLDQWDPDQYVPL